MPSSPNHLPSGNLSFDSPLRSVCGIEVPCGSVSQLLQIGNEFTRLFV